MAVPKRRTSRSKQGMRRSHHAIRPSQLQYCKNCNEPVMAHRVCSNCGYFQGRIVVTTPESSGS